MLVFDPNDPYPFVSEGAHSYTDAQRHAALVDAWLGIKIDPIESTLARPEPSSQTWVGLPVQAMLTPYTELRFILGRLSPLPGSTIVDLGAGYGRMGFVLGRHYPDVRFIGYEIVTERVQEGVRSLSPWGYPGVRLETADLHDTHFRPQVAEFYFLYDFGTRLAIEKTLKDLQEIALRQAITVVGRGRASRDSIERQHPWLSQVVPPEHHSHFSIYRSQKM